MNYQQFRKQLQSPRQLRLPLHRRHPRFSESEIEFRLNDPARSQFVIDFSLRRLIDQFEEVAIAVAISTAFDMAWPVIFTCSDELIVETDIMHPMEILAAMEFLVDISPDIDQWPWTWHSGRRGDGPNPYLLQDQIWQASGQIQIAEGQGNVYTHICADNALAASNALLAATQYMQGERALDVAYYLRSMAYNLASSLGLWNWYYKEDSTVTVPDLINSYIVRWYNRVHQRLAVRA